MATFTYTRNRPHPPNNPSSDVPDMETNCNSIDDIINVDHYSFGQSNLDGYHKISHMQNQGSFPANIAAPIAGMTQIYSLLYTPDTVPASPAGAQLYSTNDGGTVQLTGTAQTSEGWCWAGGLLLQWGRVTQAFSSGSTTGTVTFQSRSPGVTIPFPNNCFIVTTTPFITASNPNSQASANIRQSTLSNTKFDWQFFTNSSDYKGFFWFAIGN